jgi:hypothetical protein
MIQKTGRKICYKKLLKKNDTKNRGKKMLQKVRNKKCYRISANAIVTEPGKI